MVIDDAIKGGGATAPGTLDGKSGMVTGNLGFPEYAARSSMSPRAGASSTRTPAYVVAHLGQKTAVYIGAVMKTTGLVKRG